MTNRTYLILLSLAFGGLALAGNASRFVGSVLEVDQFKCTDYTDDSATTGNRTVNKPCGKNAVAAAGTAVTITNSFVAATDHVSVVIQTNDATAVLKNVVPAAGSFTVNFTAAATGTTVFSWRVDKR